MSLNSNIVPVRTGLRGRPSHGAAITAYLASRKGFQVVWTLKSAKVAEVKASQVRTGLVKGLDPATVTVKVEGNVVKIKAGAPKVTVSPVKASDGSWKVVRRVEGAKAKRVVATAKSRSQARQLAASA